MKKMISILLGLAICLSMCFCFPGCGKGKEIKLTLDNYKEYLNIERCSVYEETKGVPVGYFGTLERCYQLSCGVKTTGASTNFNFNNVKIKVRCHGTYGTNTLVSASLTADSGSIKSFDEIIEVSTNIAGSCSFGETLVSAPAGKAIVEVRADCEIVGISGTVTPA